MNTGKVFETDFKSSIPSYCFIHRLRDSAQSYKRNDNLRFCWDNECDFFIYDTKSHLFYALELKSTKFKSLNYQIDENDNSSKMIKHHQIKSLKDMSIYDGIIPCFIFNFRDENTNIQRTYYQNIMDFSNMIFNINKRSFNEVDLLRNNAIKINGAKKRVRYTWDIDGLLKVIGGN